MTGQKEIFDRWLAWNVRGKGKEKSSSKGGGRYRYHGQVLYSHDWPLARLIKGAGVDWVCLSKSGTHPTNPPGWISPRLSMTITVPCIGAFSKFHEDVLPELEQHERIKWLSHLEAQLLIDDALEAPAGTLVVKPAHDSTGAKKLLGRMATIEKVYTTYNNAFGLKWPPWPDIYEKKLLDVLDQRRHEYQLPKNVEKRQRAAARREGIKAFDVSDEE